MRRNELVKIYRMNKEIYEIYTALHGFVTGCVLMLLPFVEEQL